MKRRRRHQVKATEPRVDTGKVIFGTALVGLGIWWWARTKRKE